MPRGVFRGVAKGVLAALLQGTNNKINICTLYIKREYYQVREAAKKIILMSGPLRAGPLRKKKKNWNLFFQGSNVPTDIKRGGGLGH